jgi:hypothetical protein
LHAGRTDPQGALILARAGRDVTPLHAVARQLAELVDPPKET